ncbi:lipase family protein [Aldersonia sp. NBC_00410]|uniref:lipase family protein n=1 Tax=Aldersonia sp. NBC_00410 TaxID=2975954 RepID=UPI002253542F|nr:lipase family protein [Aldersonia sp. NBC_00410]MCX5044694.1 lipase family protein [Aldersonia sp. NBC_00410]
MHDTRRRALATLATVLFPLFAALPTAGTAVAVPIYPAPDTDAFYAQTPDMAAHANGDVLASRQVPAPGFPGSTAWQLKYRSTNSAGAPIAAVTTLLVPAVGGPNRPLVSYQPFINSLGLQCAPSHSLFNGTLQEAPALNALLARGWAVAVPDHLGPQSSYGAAALGGRLVLDGIRAVQRFPAAALGNSPVGMAGYSGGGMATGWAAALAPSYAPELRIVGAAQGGVPVNIGQLALDLGNTSSPLFGLGFAAALGIEREYPQTANISDRLKPEGVQLRGQIANACTDQIVAAGANKSYSDVANGPLQADPAGEAVLNENSLQLYPGVPRTPIYEWHGANDPVRLDLVRQTTGRYCAAGTPVQLDVIPGADHGGAIVPGAIRAVSYLGDRFAGLPAPSNC